MTPGVNMPFNVAGRTTAAPAVAWGHFGLERSPFPDDGESSQVLYQAHLTDELTAVNQWFARAFDRNNGGIAPMALYGSLGVGKSHLLKFIERASVANEKGPATRVSLSDASRRVHLADLLLAKLPTVEKAATPDGRGVDLAIAVARRASDPDAQLTLPDGLVKRALTAIARLPADERDAGITTFGKWMSRQYTTPKQRATIGLADPLNREGAALNAVADLLWAARDLDLLATWFFLIDQLEDLWRKDQFTASRRANFLTELRLLADRALSGAPIAVLAAWNTQIDDREQARLLGKVADHLDRDYRALWQRFAYRVDLPKLSLDDVWPFAEAFLRIYGVVDGARDQRGALYRLLSARRQEVVDRLNALSSGGTGYPARLVLQAWRDIAQELVDAA